LVWFNESIDNTQSKNKDKKMNKYLIIDKFTISRESFCSLISETDNSAIVCQAYSMDQAETILQQNGLVEFFIYNPAYQQSDCNENLKQLKRLNPQASILVVSHSRNYSHAKGLVRDGADILVSVNSTRKEICAAIQALVAGRSFRYKSFEKYKEVQSDVRIANAVSKAKNKDDKVRHFKLTNRQREVLDYVTKGYANKLIAYELGVSEGTVKLHVSSILRALKVTNRTEAAMRAGQFLKPASHQVNEDFNAMTT
jgi:DNA-binding NarL/FixJ family response regulator